MKRLALAVLSLVTALCLLAGCNDGYPAGQTVVYEDLQITLPGDFLELSQENIDPEATFLYGRNTLIFKAMAEEKAALPEVSLDTYTAYVLQGNELSCTPERFGDGYLFSYEVSVGGENYTYITAVFQGNTNFWLLQFYCPSANLTENQPEIDRIFSAVQLQK